MELIVDANILFAVLIAKGKTEKLIFQEELNLFAPEFLFKEFNKYTELILEKTNRSNNEFKEILHILKNKIKTVPNKETEKFIMQAKKICPDPNDIEYFALALKLKCAIWSNDKKLKEQNVIRIYSTEELNTIFR